MSKTLHAVAATALAVALWAAPAQATPDDPPDNHGQCVSQSEKPDGKGGRSEAAQTCPRPAPEPEPDPLECTVNGEVEVSSEADTVTVTGTEPAGSSYECALDIPVSAGDEVSFDYALTGDPCGGGVPRIFVTVDGTNYNSIDGDPECDNAEGSTITFAIPEDGTVTYIGLVYDRADTDSVTYSNVTVAGEELDF